MAENLPKQTITTETSKKWSLSLPDFWRSALTTLWVSLVTIVLQFLDAAITALTTSGSLQFNWTNLLLTAKIAIATWIGDSLRRLLKDSVTVIRVKPGLAEVVKKNDNEDDAEIPTTPPPVH